MLQQQGLVERKVRRSAGDSLRRRGRPSWVFAATASTAWSHDLRVSKMSEGTRKSGQKEKEEEEEQNIEEDEEGGREGIYIIVVEELSKELLATCEVHFEDCLFLFRLLLSIYRA